MAETEHLDVVIVGAGLSGIGAGYRLQSECPDKTYAILEARGATGGTWDLFRYPGIRSDSDMFTLSYPFRPWRGDKTITDGSSILDYIRDTAAESGIRDHIRLRNRLVSASWSSRDARWSLELDITDDDGRTERSFLTCSFLYACTGYYNYERGHEPAFPGIDDFAGQVIRPQFWPQDLDYRGKRVVVIGSGATAVTLVPAMADDAAHVTMLQRSPTYITAVPSRDKFSDWARRRLPARLAHRLARTKNMLVSQGFYQLCRRRPELAKKLMREQATRILGSEEQVRENFTPNYQPWDQRLCVIPGGDLYRTLKSGAASIVTDTIDTFTRDGLRLSSGEEVKADVVVTATGLSMLPLGGAEFTVDGRHVDLARTRIYRGLMLSGIPNLALCVGYTNASWTLRADLSSRYVCRLLKYLDRHGHRSAVPIPDGPTGERPLLDLNSGYVRRAVDRFPKQGERRPWTMSHNYLLDAPTSLFAALDDHMIFDPTQATLHACLERADGAATADDDHEKELSR